MNQASKTSRVGLPIRLRFLFNEQLHGHLWHNDIPFGVFTQPFLLCAGVALVSRTFVAERWLISHFLYHCYLSLVSAGALYGWGPDLPKHLRERAPL